MADFWSGCRFSLRSITKLNMRFYWGFAMVVCLISGPYAVKTVPQSLTSIKQVSECLTRHGFSVWFLSKPGENRVLKMDRNRVNFGSCR